MVSPDAFAELFPCQPSARVVAGVARGSGTSERVDIFWPPGSWRSGIPSGGTAEARAEASELVQTVTLQGTCLPS